MQVLRIWVYALFFFLYCKCVSCVESNNKKNHHIISTFKAKDWDVAIGWGLPEQAFFDPTTFHTFF